MNINELARQVEEASLLLAVANTELKDKALRLIAAALQTRKDEIISANRADLERSKNENLPEPLLKRLKFDEAKIADVTEGIASLLALADPVGKTLLSTELDDGLELYKVSCPIGVIGVIFESRPDALVQIATLCLKSGNAVLLKGGAEAKETNAILAEIIIQAATEAGLPPKWAALLTTRSDVNEMLKMDKQIDLIIPRGSNEFVRHIMDNSNIPVMGHADGICHCYVDKEADIAMAAKIVLDAKTQYVAVCNATETLLVHEKIAAEFLPVIKEVLVSKNVELVGCARTQALIAVNPATEEDWRSEYLDYKLAIKVVSTLEQAIDHINTYGSGHTDSIVTGNEARARRFMDFVDAGNVFWNCSTRFSDGFRYGFGAEVGVSTGKLHARGPVGLEGLLIYKYKLLGNGHVVEDYANRSRTFKHRNSHKKY
ncbi:MAG: glutamate-5-semialdehyde dehydrogenase [Firmicutes bacterium]|nr:glutamate-5-semialdehyde dehydrogenase [Dethiobacter sp.]MCL4462479.1 glutamate-5-semialdehyde dehydrogenase [Bacillota bacterium]MCL5993720.1 glutamate-5-semialdehyde dehydrogenase [Bacillota bacterium]